MGLIDGDLFTGCEFMPRSLDASAVQIQVLANNLANANNPNYKMQQVSFEDQMAEALQMKDHGDDADEKAEGTEMSATMQAEVKPFAGRWDMNQGMADLAKAQINYTMISNRMGGYYTSTRWVADNFGH
ncbi:MAG TPA: hypothetical protein VGO93_11690 [Candidatus Xenobia bacterium]|jgi:flagellar basal-body rod protein FlgB